MSTAEEEVMAAVSAAKESIHLNLLLGELGVKHDKILIKEDITACTAQAKGGLRFIRKAKHYDIALRFIQKLAVDGEVDFEYTDTKEQLADLYTKALDEEKFNYFADQIMYDAEKDQNYSLLSAESVHPDMSDAGECLEVASKGPQSGIPPDRN